MNDATAFSSSFDTYSHLWCDDRQEFLRQFLTYGHILTQEEIEAHANDGVPESPPTLDQFKEEIDSYEELYQQVSKFSDIERFDGWFKVSIRPFKQSLLNIIKKWSFMFKEHLIRHVESSLSDLQEFIAATDSGLQQQVVEGDFEGLVGVMGYIIAVKERTNNTDNMFEPLKQTIELLKGGD
jgi:dynein heavy chain